MKAFIKKIEKLQHDFLSNKAGKPQYGPLSKNNKGVSLVEIVVVFAILAVMATGSVTALVHLNNVNVKNAAKTVKSSLVEHRIDAMAKTGAWTWTMVYSTDHYDVQITRQENSTASVEVVDTIEIPSKLTGVTATVHEADGTENTGVLIGISFKKSTGAVDQVILDTATVAPKSGYTLITLDCSGNTRQLKLTNLTGTVE